MTKLTSEEAAALASACRSFPVPEAVTGNGMTHFGIRTVGGPLIGPFHTRAAADRHRAGLVAHQAFVLLTPNIPPAVSATMLDAACRGIGSAAQRLMKLTRAAQAPQKRGGRR